jgi:hypothetical protein
VESNRGFHRLVQDIHRSEGKLRFDPSFPE